MKTIIKMFVIPWSFSAFTVLVSLMTFILYIRVDTRYSRELKQIRADDKYIRDQIASRAMIGKSEKYLKYTDFYAKIIGWYSEKPQSKRSMNRYMRADFVINSYNYETWLGLPHFYFVSIAKMESDFNPHAIGYLDERGLFQHMPIDSVIGTAYNNLREMYIVSPWLAKKLEFYYKAPKDLHDPLNALKIEALLAWGYKRKYAHQAIWWVTARHWGDHRIYHLYKHGIEPPAKFVFNKGTLKEDARNPLMYYFIYVEHHSAFSDFRKDVNIDKSYIERYKKICSRQELQYIEQWKYIKELKKATAEIDAQILAIEKQKKKYDDLIKNAFAEYKKLNNIIKTGKYKKVKEVFLIGRHYFREFINKIVNKNIKVKLKIISAILIIAGVINQIIFIFGMVYIIKIIKRKRYETKINKPA